MEAFESFVALAMEDEGLVVSEAIKFPVTRPTRKVAYAETQTHGFEVDLVGARVDKLVLASVKSFFGSHGVAANHVMAVKEANGNRLYAMLNDPVVRDAVLAGACKRFGYDLSQVEMRLYVGKFGGGKKGNDRKRIEEWAANQIVGGGPITIHGLESVALVARKIAASKTYRDNAALVAMKVLEAAGMLTPLLSD